MQHGSESYCEGAGLDPQTSHETQISLKEELEMLRQDARLDVHINLDEKLPQNFLGLYDYLMRVQRNITIDGQPVFNFTPSTPTRQALRMIKNAHTILRILKIWNTIPDLTLGRLLMNAFTTMKRYPESMTTGNIAEAVIGNIVSESDDGIVKALEKLYGTPAQNKEAE